jgi:small subunit ribosomal protein S1
VGASARWPAGTVVAGVVKRVTDFGAFVELTPGVEGLVHISELSGEHVRAVGDVVREGQPVQAKVVSVDEEKRRVSLSIKQASAAVAEMAAAEAPDTQAVAPKKRKKPLKGGLD